MTDSKYNRTLTLQLYLLASVLFATYGGRVCPMLETLSMREIGTHVAATFIPLFLVRHFGFCDHNWLKTHDTAKLDTTLFFIASIPLALFYNLNYDFPLDSNLKVLLGMAMFGFFTGSILQIVAKLDDFESLIGKANNTELVGVRRSIVKQMIVLMTLLMFTLTFLLLLVALKDVFWLQHNPEKVLNGSGSVSVIKEFGYVFMVLTGYSVTIMYLWSKLMGKVLNSQETSLLAVSAGDINIRLPIFEHNEIGSMAALTNDMLDNLQSTQSEVKATRDVAIISLSALAESRDNETGAHIIRTQKYVRSLAMELSKKPQHSALLTPEYIELLYKSAPLHDVGKVGIPDSVLLKPGKLTDDEFDIMKGHPEIGAKALSFAEKHLGSSSFLRVAKEISLTHHEKWDGSGYPNALSGDSIPLSGRLMALADVYDALISKRVYKPAFSHEKAKGIILEGKGSHFDPAVVDAFLAIEDEFVSIAAAYKDGDDA